MSPGRAGPAETLDQRPVVAAADEAHLLALRGIRGREPGRPGLRPRAGLHLPAEREPAPVEDRGGHRRQHVGLVLGGVGPAGDEGRPGAVLDPGVVPRRDPGGAQPVGDLRDRREAERAVAAHAGVGGAPAGVRRHEVVDDRPPEAVTQVDRQVRDAEGVARPARGSHRVGRAAGPLGVRRVRVDPQPKRHADGHHPRIERLRERDRGVHPAAHRHDDPGRVGLEPDARHGRRERGVEGVGGERRAAARGGGRLDVRVQLGGADAGCVEQGPPLGQPAGQLGRGRRVRACERPMAGGGDAAAVEAQADPNGVPARRVPGLAVDRAGTGLTGHVVCEGEIDAGGRVHGRRLRQDSVPM